MGLNSTTFNVKICMLVFEVQMPMGIIYACHFIRTASCFSLLFILLESVLIRYWTEFVWKTVKPIDDQFVIFCLTLINTFVSSYLSILKILSGGDGKHFTGQQIIFQPRREITNQFKYEFSTYWVRSKTYKKQL